MFAAQHLPLISPDSSHVTWSRSDHLPHFSAIKLARHSHRIWLRKIATTALVSLLALWLTACETVKTPPPIATPPAGTNDPAKIERQSRADRNLSEGLRLYETGSYDDALRSILLALDSALLTIQNQITARKHLAFIHCVSNRETSCRDEFDRVIAIDPNFMLTPAEAGHPSWGAVFRNLRAEMEARKAGRPIPTQAVVSGGVRLLGEGMNAYEAADYTKATKLFLEAQQEGLETSDRIKAKKHIAFCYCLTNRNTACQNEFASILDIRPDFTLEPAEAGHPLWGPVFRSAKSKQKLNKK
jgi:hypothetical protein